MIIKKSIKKIELKDLILFSILIFSSSCYMYSDSVYTINQGIQFWDYLFTGKIFDYYLSSSSVYSIIMNLIMSIWQLPLYILNLFTQNYILDYFCAKIWGKLVLIILVYVCGYLIRVISRELHISEKAGNIASYLFCSSTFIFSAVCVIGQVDIYGVFFTLLALICLAKDKKVLYVILFTVAVQCKFFPLFIFIPIILLKQKKVWKIFVEIVLPVCIYWISDLPFKHIYSQTKDTLTSVVNNSVTNDLLTNMVSNSIAIMGYRIPIAIVLFCIVCIVAFFIEIPEDRNRMQWYIYFGFAGISSILLSYKETPYRIIYLIPFASLLLCYNLCKFKRKIFMESIVSLGLITVYVIDFHWCYDFNLMYNMLIDKILPLRKFELHGTWYLYNIVNDEKYYGLWNVFACVYAIWIIQLLIVNCPIKKDIEFFETDENDKSINTALIWRTIIGFIFPCITILIYLITVVSRIMRVFID